MTRPLYLYYGEEGVLIHEAVQQLKAQYEIQDLQLDVIDGKTFSLDLLSQAIQTVPLLSLTGKKMVHVRDLPLLMNKNKKSEDKDDDENQAEKDQNVPTVDSRYDPVERIIQLLKSAEDTVVILFTFEEDLSQWKKQKKVDKRTKLYKLISKEGQVIEFNPFSEYESGKLIEWVRARVHTQGKKINQDTLFRLIDMVGHKRSLLVSEIEKLITFIGTLDSIETSDVETLASPSQNAAFTLINALRDREIAPALDALKSSLYYGQSDMALLMNWANQFRNLLHIKVLQAHKKSLSDITHTVGGHPYAIKLLASSTRKFSIKKLYDILIAIAETDLQIKTGQGDKALLLEMLVVDICQ